MGGPRPSPPRPGSPWQGRSPPLRRRISRSSLPDRRFRRRDGREGAGSVSSCRSSPQRHDFPVDFHHIIMDSSLAPAGGARNEEGRRLGGGPSFSRRGGALPPPSL